MAYDSWGHKEGGPDVSFPGSARARKRALRLSRSTVVLPSDERTRTTILSVPQIFPVLTGHTVGPRNMYENGRYAELGGKKWYHGDSPSSVGLLASLSIYIDQMTNSWNSGDDQKERAATCQGSHIGQGSPALRPQTGAGTRPHSGR